MYKNYKLCAVLPARDEALSIAQVVKDLHRLQIFDRIIVCDNGSTDDTAAKALASGAEVVRETSPGYGAACLAALAQIDSTDIVVFVDADNSLLIAEALDLLDAIVDGADCAIGVRIDAWRQSGSMTMPQQFGNWLATRLIKLIWDYQVSDLGPFRAIRFAALKALDMQDRRFGWTVEMQVKAIQSGLKLVEVPVHYRRRLGKSKISGTISGVVGAAFGIIGTIIKLALRNPSDPSCKTVMPRKP